MMMMVAAGYSLIGVSELSRCRELNVERWTSEKENGQLLEDEINRLWKGKRKAPINHRPLDLFPYLPT